MTPRWDVLADGVYARRYPDWDLTIGLVVGDGACLVIDTRADAEQGAELANAVREVTPHPWTVALTHDHFDHAFGVSAFLPCEVWAHENCHRELAARDKPDLALPDRLLTDRAELDIGGRRVGLAHFGPAHSDNDVVVHVPDASVVFAGDLVEFSPPGSFTAESFGTDTTLSGWPAAIDGVLALGAEIILPGHGPTVDRDFLLAQKEILDRLITLDSALRAGEVDAAAAIAASPVAEDVTRAALRLG
ncbi:MBL fold metallo-hydrolase [Amycolatopsis sp. YIM 10]|uniref:MBL fold metallo-hydrolase n=1 Tax=Amycolatopsis sp. YIM 10 TaxID=2653857 RepID=UPI00129022E6|nr:MBL fold metallo-hydrolase [Amycolatopsis sp. YIM 10]QFU92959.1 Beta-lactamase type II precursor [Amycolatopsis sp. YIM 10]